MACVDACDIPGVYLAPETGRKPTRQVGIGRLAAGISQPAAGISQPDEGCAGIPRAAQRV